MRSIPNTDIISYEDLNGLVLNGTIANVYSGIPTTANIFAGGCILIDISTGFSWKNVGTIAVPIWSLGVSTINFSLTAAQLTTIHSVPIELIPAQGAGKCIVVDEIVLKLTAGATPFNFGNSTLFFYGTVSDGSTIDYAAASLDKTAFVNSATNVVMLTAHNSQSGLPIPANQNVNITSTADASAGNGTVAGSIRYHVVSTT